MDEKYMKRCIELARKGMGAVAPNPMVGSVIVHNGTIIGEGYHRQYGKEHAEVNAVASVREEKLLRDATLYVNLEPCFHFGKTPPCSELILEKEIPKVVIGSADPNPVSGGGMKQLREKGVEVVHGILEKECLELNRRFITFQKEKRPWILLKWAKTEDGFIDVERKPGDTPGVNWITGPEARQWVHRWRSEEMAILVGTRTALVDDPELTVRHWQGRDPVRMVIDREGKLPGDLKLFNDRAETWVFTNHPKPGRNRIQFIGVGPEEDYIDRILRHLYESDVSSMMVEGGTATLNSFIDKGLWDEARVFTGRKEFGRGIPSPEISNTPRSSRMAGPDLLEIFRNG